MAGDYSYRNMNCELRIAKLGIASADPQPFRSSQFAFRNSQFLFPLSRMLRSAISQEVSLMKKLFVLSLTLALFFFSEWPTLAQDQPAQQATTEEQEKQKAEREKNAYRLLDQ